MLKLKKLLIITVISSILILVIYLFNKKDTITYINLGDNYSIKKDNNYVYKYLNKKKKIKCYNDYSKKNETIEILTERIKTTGSIKKDLRESDIVTLSIGYNDFYNNIEFNRNKILDLKENIDILLLRLEDLIKEIRKYAKYQIILIGYYNPVPFLFNTNANEIETLFLYIDGMIKEKLKKYDIDYISLYDIFKDNNYIGENKYPNDFGYKRIATEVVFRIKK